ncbi:MAG: hypothetical protein QGG05_14220 [Candidatus Latescibacteria bacterium]|nr:hypothetical protein [Candidatus Latescibacterota bacterium]MEC8932225.1 hypothetical protein [Candidatus Latescibacterota bacterium]MEE3041763.1 hypothetical protein [Candidatus Latescibacterota bacterium]MEE3337535.1 hypothetical protein [Candidatus Latescibacterota bacterium]
MNFRSQFKYLFMWMSLSVLGACTSGLDPTLQALVMSSDADSLAAGSRSVARPAWATEGRGDTAALSQVVLLLPMKDETTYLKRSVWPVQTGIPAVLGDSLATNPFYRVLPVDSAAVFLTEDERLGNMGADRAIAIGRFLGADWVLFGKIKGLTMDRLTATVPLGGHRRYSGVARVHLFLYNVVDGRRGPDIVVEEEINSKRTGITNPASHVHLDRQFRYIDQIPWAAEDFTTSLVGQALAACAARFVEQVAEIVKPPPTPGVSEPKIIDIDGDSAYINIGLADGIQNGDKFGVWDKGRELRDPETGQSLGHALPRRVGVVQVEQVLSDNLTLARILDGQASILQGYSIRPE